MLNTDERLKPNQRDDIIERFYRFIQEHEFTQAQVAREINAGSSTLSDVVRKEFEGKTGDKWLIKIHNWMELTGRRKDIVASRKFVKHSVAREILTVASVVAETCMIGVVFGPARIGKTFTLTAIKGDQAFGDPVLITIDDSTMRPFALCRLVCEHFKLSSNGTFDRVFRRLVQRLKDTKRMLMFDEADLASYRTLEWIRQLHDQTGCPILLAGKPKVYEHLGFRDLGDFSEKLDQLGGRIVIKRDLTERTRGENPEPLYTLEDVRKMVRQCGLVLKVSPDALKWLQDRASTLGCGGIGKAMVNLYLAAKVAYAKGDPVITAEHLEDVDMLTMGHEDVKRIIEAVAQASGMRRVL